MGKEQLLGELEAAPEAVEGALIEDAFMGRVLVDDHQAGTDLCEDVRLMELPKQRLRRDALCILQVRRRTRGNGSAGHRRLEAGDGIELLGLIAEIHRLRRPGAERTGGCGPGSPPFGRAHRARRREGHRCGDGLPPLMGER